MISVKIDNHQAFTSLFCRKRLPLNHETWPFTVRKTPFCMLKACLFQLKTWRFVGQKQADLRLICGISCSFVYVFIAQFMLGDA